VSGSLSNYQSRQEYVLKYTTVAGVDGFDGRERSQKQWLRPLFNNLNKSIKNIALILASVNAISFLCSVPYLLNVITKGGGKDPTKP
jgi:hypothetical protein